MAVWKAKLAGCVVKIHEVDHRPAHCHAFVGHRDLKVDLHTLAILNPPPHELPSNLRKALARRQAELLEAWEKVRVSPPRRR